MKISQTKNNIIYLFLAIFFIMKIAGLHALTHIHDEDDDLVHCTICDHIITHNLTPTLKPDLQEFSIENTEFVVRKEIIKNYSFIVSSAIASNQLLSRPPPFFI